MLQFATACDANLNWAFATACDANLNWAFATACDANLNWAFLLHCLRIEHYPYMRIWDVNFGKWAFAAHIHAFDDVCYSYNMFVSISA
jgi:hypothetical protein